MLYPAALQNKSLQTPCLLVQSAVVGSVSLQRLPPSGHSLRTSSTLLEYIDLRIEARSGLAIRQSGIKNQLRSTCSDTAQNPRHRKYGCEQCCVRGNRPNAGTKNGRPTILTSHLRVQSQDASLLGDELRCRYSVSTSVHTLAPFRL